MTKTLFTPPSKGCTPQELLAIPHIRASLKTGCRLCATNRDQFVAGDTAYDRGNLARAALNIMLARRDRRLARDVAVAARIQPTGRILAAVAEKRRAELHTAIESADSQLFRMPSGKWVGGDHQVIVTMIDKPMTQTPTASGESKIVWHPKKSWKGTNSVRRYLLPADWMQTVHAAGIRSVDERLTLEAVPVETSTVEAAWRVITARQSTGFDLKTESGFVVMFAGVIHFGKTIAAAKKKCAAEWKEVFTR